MSLFIFEEFILLLCILVSLNLVEKNLSRKYEDEFWILGLNVANCYISICILWLLCLDICQYGIGHRVIEFVSGWDL